VRVATLVAVVVVVLAPAGAAARNPWQLRCPSMPREQRVPAAVRGAARAFSPWAGHSAEDAIRAGPVYLLALSYKTQISRDGDDSDGAGNDLHRALVAVAPWYAEPVTLTGRRLGRRRPHTTLAFSTNGASHCTVSGVDVNCRPRLYREAPALRVPPGRRWRLVRMMLVVPRTGCFRIVASGPGLRRILPLAVPGPDWRTPS
jgi:hypothetical protein